MCCSFLFSLILGLSPSLSISPGSLSFLCSLDVFPVFLGMGSDLKGGCVHPHLSESTCSQLISFSFSVCQLSAWIEVGFGNNLMSCIVA